MADLEPHHEKACQLRASGVSQVDAYAEAFDQHPDSNANNSSRFFRRPEIRARVNEIRDWQTKLADLNQAWVLVQLKSIAKNASTIGNANLDDFFEKDDEGRRISIALADVPRAKIAALEEITIEEYTEGRGETSERIKRTKIKLRSSNEARAALELLGKHLGMWPNKIAAEHTGKDGGPMEIADVSDADRIRALEALVKRVATEGAV